MAQETLSSFHFPFSTFMSALLTIHDLHVFVDTKEVVSGVDLIVKPGEIHAIMGPNGSGKSSFVNALMGNPRYTITQGSARFLDRDLLAMEPHERAQAGLFLAFQYPKEIAGVSLRSFLYAALSSQLSAGRAKAKKPSSISFKKILEEAMETLHMDPAFAERSLNQGFSGGEKKKAEILQMKILEPRLALLDETDSGLDIDALRIVAGGVNAMRSKDFSAVIVTHYARLLDYVKPDHVHVMVGGRIVENGGPQLAQRLEKEGYVKFS